MDFKAIFVQKDFSIVHSVTSSAIPMHTHPEYVVGYYFGGRASCRLNSNARLEFRPGEVGLLNPGEAHEDLALRTKRDYLVVGVKRVLFDELISDAGWTGNCELYFSSPKVQADPRMRAIFDSLREEVDGQGFGRAVVIRSLVTELSIYVLRHFTPFAFRPEKLNLNRPVAHWRVRRAIEYLHEAYTQEFDLSRISETVGLSKYYLERVFKKATGLSPHTYMMLLRLEKAKELLASPSKPIVEIAQNLGFSDQSHFTNAFKRFTGVTPRAYRLGTR